MRGRTTHDDVDAGPGLWIGLALGLPVVLFGLRAVLESASRTHPAELARWIVGAALVHDLLVLPLAIGIGWVAHRVVPTFAWPPVRWALATTAIVVVVSIPFVRGWGRSASVPSLLDRDYGAGVAALVATLWVVALVWAAVRWGRDQQRVSRR